MSGVRSKIAAVMVENSDMFKPEIKMSDIFNLVEAVVIKLNKDGLLTEEESNFKSRLQNGVLTEMEQQLNRDLDTASECWNHMAKLQNEPEYGPTHQKTCRNEYCKCRS